MRPYFAIMLIFMPILKNILNFQDLRQRSAGLWLALAAVAASPAQAVEDETPGHVAYFGFYASAMGHWNHTAELAPFTNLTWVQVGHGDAPVQCAGDIVMRLREAREAGVQAVIGLESYLFSDVRGTRRADADIEEFLVDLRARLEHEDLLESVAMLYPKDEPFREFRRHREPNFIEQYVTGEVYEDIHADLEHVNALVKSVFPGKPLGVILSGLELHHRFFAIPASYDWVGFDCYANLFDACEDRSFIQLYGRLLSHMAPHQRLIAVPEAWALHEETRQPGFPDTLSARLALHHEMVMAEPRFVAIIPFLWSFEAAENTPGIGLDRFPEWFDDGADTAGSDLVAQVMNIGQDVKYGIARYPSLAWADTEPASRPSGEIRGEIVRVDADGLVMVRALDSALPHKNLRVRLVVTGPDGDTLYKTRVTRTDLAWDIAVPDYPEDGLLIGTHVLQHRIPAQWLEPGPEGANTLHLMTYADGPGAVLAHHATRSLAGVR